jgi:hypothetical protein
MSDTNISITDEELKEKLAELLVEMGDPLDGRLSEMREAGYGLRLAVAALIETAPNLKPDSPSPVIRMLMSGVDHSVRKWKETVRECCGTEDDEDV